MWLQDGVCVGGEALKRCFTLAEPFLLRMLTQNMKYETVNTR